jgi:GTPase Era involved in 16S rRNA processing
MSYRVHRLEINMEEGASTLETFLNGLAGEVVTIIPNIKKTTLTQIYGVSRKIDFLLIVERT